MGVKMSKRDTTLLSSVAAALVLGGGYMFVLKPAQADLGTAKTSLDEATSARDFAQNQLKALSVRKTDGTRVDALTLRTLKAIPVGPQTAGSLLQIERMAKRADVTLSGITSNTRLSFGTIEAETFAIRADGNFFDISDFLYRMQRQVEVGRTGRPQVRGRLLATTKVEILPSTTSSSTGAKLSAASKVSATLEVVAFNLSAGTTAGSAGSPATTTTDGATSADGAKGSA